MIEPWLMTTDSRILESLAAEPNERRPDAVVIDWELAGKADRQHLAPALIGLETTIRPDDPDAVERVTAAGFRRVITRINALGPQTADEVAAAHASGASAVLLPMWRHPDEVRSVLDLVAGRLELGVMIETMDAVDNVMCIPELPIAFAFVGMVDLAIGRRSRSIFEPLVDGTMQKIVDGLDWVPFGFGGLTLPELGSPIPSRLLLAEMLRLGASFSFMRRSFMNDIGGGPPGPAIAAIRAAAEALGRRTSTEVERDRRALVRQVEATLVVPR